MQQEVDYSERVVAFLDILGFRSLVGRLSQDPKLHSKLHSALAEIRMYESLAGDQRTALNGLEASVFSDSIVISAPRASLWDILWACIGLQSRLLALRILTRGGISFGPTFHRNDVLYGAGMINAYDLESKTAIYPRVVIDPQLAPELSEVEKTVLCRQSRDGLWHTDPFCMGVLPPGSDDLVEDGWVPHLVFLENFEKTIESEITNATDVGHFTKWNWLKSEHTAALKFHREHGMAKFWYVMKLGEEKKKAEKK